MLMSLVSVAACQTINKTGVAPDRRANPEYASRNLLSLAQIEQRNSRSRAKVIRADGVAVPEPTPLTDISLAIPWDKSEQKKAKKDHEKPAVALHAGKKKHLGPSPYPGQADFGTFIYNTGTTAVQVFARQQMIPSLTLPSSTTVDQTLYAPTLLAPNYCGAESVTAYWRFKNASSSQSGWGVWDSNKNGAGVSTWGNGYPEPMDSTWQSKYTATYNDS